MSDDLRDYEITPDDLGCMGEKEIDPGVMEEAVTSGSAGLNSPIPLSFQSIPMDNRRAYRKLYDGFERKDMSFEDFCVEMFAMSSPTMMQHDLGKMMGMRENRNQIMTANKHAIEKSMN